ncbi:MAG: enhanced intracellular survival protein Eis [Pirellulales bacterium]
MKFRSLKAESRRSDSFASQRKASAKKGKRPAIKNAAKEAAKSVSKNGLKAATRPKSRKSKTKAEVPLRAIPPAAADVPTYLAEPLTEPPRLGVANAGDHHGVHQFLTAVFRGPSRDSFLSTLDDPFYEPCDRLLIKSGDIILSHAHLTKRAMCFNGVTLPVGGLNWVGTLPEFRGRGHASSLVRLAERRMVEDGAVAGLLRTQSPHFFRREGWAVCGRHSHSQADTREVLAQLSNQAAALDPNAVGLSIRPWRQVELPALMRLYSRHTTHRAGALARSEAYWRWLVSCKVFDQVFVAIHGPDRWELEDDHSPIVGYVIIKDNQILEMMTDPAYPRAATGLVARACGEALERDLTSVTFHAPVDNPVHHLFLKANGRQHHHEAHQGEVFMMKLFDPVHFLRAMCGELHARADAAALPRPCELGLRVEDHKMRLAFSRRSVKLIRGKLGRGYLDFNIADFTRLVMGHLDLDQAVKAGRVSTSTRTALQTARAAFPRFPLWRSPVDDLLGT